ncbi:MAG: chemotaxis protein CheW [Deltaproteobacteria bacterium]|nr:chemotaxis protein CheW [Deltaproteobacteria bacterium]
MEPNVSRAVRERRRRAAGVDKNLVGFLVGDVQYAVDILRVREILRPLPILALPHAPPAIVGVADHRGEVVPVLEVRRRFGLEPATDARRAKWVLVMVGGRTVGLAVDAITGVLAASEVDHRPPPSLGLGDAARGIASVISHQSGLVFVLDVDRVAAPAQIVDVAPTMRGGA